MKYIDTMHRTIAEQSGQELGSQGDSQESSVKTEFPMAALGMKNMGFVEAHTTVALVASFSLFLVNDS